MHAQCTTLFLSVSAEPIIVEVTFRNPLKVSLALSILSLLWRFTPDGVSEELAITNEDTLILGVGNLGTFPLRNCDVYSI